MQKVLISLLILIMFTTVLSAKKDKTKFLYTDYAENLISQLCAGNQDVADHLDWEHISMFGTDFGADYDKLTNDVERVEYRHTFIRLFGDRCKVFNVMPGNLSGWKLKTVSDSVAVVYASRSYDWFFMKFTIKGTEILLKDIYLEYADAYQQY